MSEVVVVTGVGGPAGRAAATWFRARGVIVVGTDLREVEAPVCSFRRVPAAGDPAFERVLLELVVRERASLLVPTVTEELPVAARLREALAARGCAAAVSSPDAVAVANDKLRTAQELARRGLSVPLTLGPSAQREEIALALGFPLLSKPRFGRGGRGVRLYDTAAELSSSAAAEVVYQEFICGDEYDANLYVAEDGSVPAAVMLRKTRLRDGRVGNALRVERTRNEAVEELCVRVARALKLSGPLDMDVRLRRNGSPALLEVNARIGANVLSAPEVMEALLQDWRNGRCV